jgi:Di-sulfide bridge nucleocytoplasmic transport domain
MKPQELTKPANQTFLFSNFSGALPSGGTSVPNFANNPKANPAFTTPRKAFSEDLFSSDTGISSPDNADGEETPEPAGKGGTIKASQAMTYFKGNKAEREENRWLKNASSAGRGEIRRGNYTDALARKVQKRRRHQAERGLTRSRKGSFDSDFDSSDDGPSGSRGNGRRRAASEDQNKGWAHWFEAHPNLPHVLSFYVQLFLNISLVSLFLYFLFSIIMTIRSDVDKKAELVIADTIAEMAGCTKSWTENGCASHKRPPALEAVCGGWERCMQRDPEAVGRAAVSAHTFADIINRFFEPISWKATVSFICSTSHFLYWKRE